MPKPKIVVLDGHTLNPGDLAWDALAALGNLKVYDRTAQNQIYQRAKTAEILIVNKVDLDSYMFSRLRKLKYVCVSATGYNNIDLAGAEHWKIPVSNVAAYGSIAVAQHVFALILHFSNQVAAHHQDVQNGGWANCPDFSYWKYPIQELHGKTLGIYGLGKIGQKVADIALAFGMKVIAHHKHPQRDAREGISFVNWEKLLQESDFISLHAPLNAQNQGIINTAALKEMKSTAYLINTSRGGLIVEADLKIALQTGSIAGAALDVLSVEPPAKDHMLMGIPNCIITPHQAWASQQSRQRLMDILVKNIQAFLAGKPINLVY